MVGRFLSWMIRGLIRHLGAFTLTALLLLLLALLSVTLGMAGVIRGFDLGLMLPAAVFGLLLGWGLAGRQPVPGWLAALITLALGSELIVVRVGQMTGTLLALLRQSAGLAWNLWRRPWAAPPEAEPALLLLTNLWADLSTVWLRLFDWAAALVFGEPTFDPVAAALVWGLALWLAAAWAGWAVRRRAQPLPGLTPAGALLAVTLAYKPDRSAVLLPLLAATLLLMALVGHRTREQRWETTGLDFPLDIRVDMIFSTFSISLLLVMMATAVPSLSVRQITRFAQRLIGRPAAEAGSLGLKPDSGPAGTFDAMRAGGLPRRHLIGSGPELSEQVALVIRTGDAPDRSPVRYYWRSITYDRYTGRGWYTGRTDIINYRAGEPAILAIPGTHRLLQQEIQVVDNPDRLLYAAGELVTVDRDFTVAWRTPGDAFGATVDAAGYRAESLLPVAGEAQLRAAGRDYPPWVRQRYLFLPDTVPRRVLSLARDLTATAPTPYDRAKAIENHLRTFPYTLDLPDPPIERDIVDYFLFNLKQGYCDYYATSMVVLARAAGLPARIAIGYLSGTFNQPDAHYVVTQADAHSWVEIYFPGYGWINFEPTGGRPALDRLADAPPPVQPDVPPSPAAGEETRDRLSGWWLSLPGGLALMALVVLGWTVADGWRLHRLSPAATVTRLYRRLYRHGKRLVPPTRLGDTPHEFAVALAGRLAGLAGRGRWASWLSPAAQEIQRLTHLYVQTLYSPHPPDRSAQIQAIQTWRRLRRRLWLAWAHIFSNRSPPAEK